MQNDFTTSTKLLNIKTIRKKLGVFCILSCHRKPNPTPNSLIVKNSTITDINDITEKFNYHFPTIGKSLVSLINNKDKSQPFYLKSPCTNSIYLQPTSTHEVMALINFFNLNKANGHDDIDPYFLKIASPIITFRYL